MLGNLEGTLATDGSSKCGSSSDNCFAFRAPPAYARVLRDAGFTVLNLANNHALDYGPSGQAQTVAALDHAGLRHTGRPGESAVLRIGKITVAVIGFAPYAWANDLRDIPGAVELVRKADAKADVVVVTMHAGAEGSDHQHVRPGIETYLGENRGNEVAFGHAVVNAGADLVIGHGPHVLRALEWYHGRLIAYSLGDFLGNGTLSIRDPAVSARCSRCSYVATAPGPAGRSSPCVSSRQACRSPITREAPSRSCARSPARTSAHEPCACQRVARSRHRGLRTRSTPTQSAGFPS